MSNRQRKLWERRELYQQTPDRYTEISLIKSVRTLFTAFGEKWKKKHEWINYLDLGCGDCKGTSVFADFLEKTLSMSVRTVGVDASTKCEISCKEKGVDFLCLNLEEEPIPLRDIQVITLFETIEHIFDTDYLVESIRNSISEDGVLLVSTLNVVCWKNRILVPLGIQPFNTEVSTRKLSYGYKYEYLRKKIAAWMPAGHIRPFTLNSLCELLEDNGFTILKTYGLENWRAFKFLEKIAKNMCTGILVIAKPS
ncbi:MAG: methyltransferase domain-containing protein [Nitrososphaeria archaeon]